MKRAPKENALTENTANASAMSLKVWIKPLCPASFHTLARVHTVTSIFPNDLIAREHRFAPLNIVSLDGEIVGILEN